MNAPRNQHRHSALVAAICLAVNSDKAALFEQYRNNDPNCEQKIEQQPVQCHVRIRPDHQQAGQIQWVANPAIGTVDDEGYWLRLRATQLIYYRVEPEIDKETQCPEGPGKKGARQDNDRAKGPTNEALRC